MAFTPRNDWKAGDEYPADRLISLEKTVSDTESGMSDKADTESAILKNSYGVVEGTPQFGEGSLKNGGVEFADGVQIGPDLILSEVDGWAGQRLSLRGKEDAHMPYFEVECCDPEDGTDGGGAIGGYQIQRLGRNNGGGAGNDREFFAIEGTESGPFRIATWASGTGEVPSLQLKAGSNYHAELLPTGLIKTGQNIKLQMPAHEQENPIEVVANRDTVVSQRNFSAASATSSPTFKLVRGRGTNAAPEPLKARDTLGNFQFGTQMNAWTDAARGTLRVIATEDHTADKQGTKFQVISTGKGTTTSNIDVEFESPSSDTRTGMMISVNKAGAVSLQQVTIGEPDSGGTGYRVLRVAN